MDVFELMKARHSVRAYNDRKIGSEVLQQLQAAVDECKRESGLHIQLRTDDPSAFGGKAGSYGRFSGVKNYIAMIGRKSGKRDEKIGYYGEKLVLKATELGLSTCWVAGSYNKSKCAVIPEKEEQLVCIITFGYSDTPGVSHKTKRPEQLYSIKAGTAPDWFLKGIEAAQLAPTAMNQQRFLFTLDGDTVTAKAFTGFYTKLDLGIAEYHFELGSGRKVFEE